MKKVMIWLLLVILSSPMGCWASDKKNSDATVAALKEIKSELGEVRKEISKIKDSTTSAVRTVSVINTEKVEKKKKIKKKTKVKRKTSKTKSSKTRKPLKTNTKTKKEITSDPYIDKYGFIRFKDGDKYVRLDKEDIKELYLYKKKQTKNNDSTVSIVRDATTSKSSSDTTSSTNKKRKQITLNDIKTNVTEGFNIIQTIAERGILPDIEHWFWDRAFVNLSVMTPSFTNISNFNFNNTIFMFEIGYRYYGLELNTYFTSKNDIGLMFKIDLIRLGTYIYRGINAQPQSNLRT